MVSQIFFGESVSPTEEIHENGLPTASFTQLYTWELQFAMELLMTEFWYGTHP
jgi:hypothetical protein